VSDSLNVLLADDHAPTRGGVRLSLEGHGFRICAEASTAQQTIEAARRWRPDVCLIDISMPGGGIEAARVIAKEVPEAAIVMLTVSRTDADIFAALRAGAAGFLLKSAEPDALVAAVRTIPRGRGLISPEVTRRPITEFASSAPQPLADPRIDALTPREREVLTLVARGLSERRPRARTQRRQDHVANALSQLDLRSSAGAAVCGRRWGATFPPAITAATPLFLVARAVAQ
jgi:DNA-binding NarL/FixJ family response regulator